MRQEIILVASFSQNCLPFDILKSSSFSIGAYPGFFLSKYADLALGLLKQS